MELAVLGNIDRCNLSWNTREVGHRDWETIERMLLGRGSWIIEINVITSIIISILATIGRASVTNDCARCIVKEEAIKEHCDRGKTGGAIILVPLDVLLEHIVVTGWITAVQVMGIKSGAIDIFTWIIDVHCR